MKSACLNSTCGSASPAGRPALSSSKAPSICSVRRSVSAPGCFWMLSTTAGAPLKPASPRLSPAAKRTCATCCSRIGRPSRQATARPCKSSRRLLRPMWRIRYSRLLRSMKPPPALLAKPFSAASICVSVTPNCAMRCGSGSTRNWRTSPPIAITCDTPAIESRRGRSTKSAYSRASMACCAAASALTAAPGASACSGSASSITSPMMDETGPMVGLISAGSCSRTSASRSATCWRLRNTSVPQSNSA